LKITVAIVCSGVVEHQYVVVSENHSG
jgi:hypothetical protein